MSSTYSLSLRFLTDIVIVHIYTTIIITGELYIQLVVAIGHIDAVELRALAHQTFRLPSRVRVASVFFSFCAQLENLTYIHVCVCVCVRAHVRSVCVCVCVCARARM